MVYGSLAHRSVLFSKTGWLGLKNIKTIILPADLTQHDKGIKIS